MYNVSIFLRIFRVNTDHINFKTFSYLVAILEIIDEGIFEIGQAVLEISNDIWTDRHDHF